MALEWNGPEVARTIRARSARASQEMAERVLAQAQANCPVLTGALKASGHIRQGGDAFDAADDTTHRTVVFDKSYAIWVEEGSTRSPGQFFLKRAFLACRDESRGILQRIFGRFRG